MKTIKKWCVVSPTGEPLLKSISDDQRAAQNKAVEDINAEHKLRLTWVNLSEKGYEVDRIEIRRLRTKEKEERDRLKSVLFEGMDPRYRFAVKNDVGGYWQCLIERPKPPSENHGFWVETLIGHSQPCRNQPETSLHWTDSLIER